MPKINVYLPEHLALEVKSSELPVSAICQRALERAVRQMGSIAPLVEAPSLLGIYGRFLGRAREALELAYQAAVHRGNNQLDAGHLLLGVLEQGSNLAVHIIETLGVNPDELILRVSEAMPREDHQVFNTPLDRMLTESSKRALSMAAREAARLGHNYIGNEHILLGLAAGTDGAAGGALNSFGIDKDAVARTHAAVLKTWIGADIASAVSGADWEDARAGFADSDLANE